MDPQVNKPLKEEDSESWAHQRPATSPDPPGTSEQPFALPEPGDELGNYLHITSPCIPGKHPLAPGLPESWCDVQFNFEEYPDVRDRKLQVRCLTAEAPGKSKWSRNNASQHIAALDWFLPLQAPPPRKSLLPPALQSSKPHSRGRHAHTTGRDHGKQEDVSHACKPQSPFLVNSRAATPNDHLPQASRHSLVPPQTAPASHSPSPDRFPLSSNSPPTTPFLSGLSRSCLTAPNQNALREPLWPSSQSRLATPSARHPLPSDLSPVSEVGEHSEVYGGVEPRYADSLDINVPTDLSPWAEASEDSAEEFKESTENSCIVLNNGAPSAGMVLDARRTMTPALMASVLASAQQLTPDDVAIQQMTIEAHAAEMQRQDALPWAANLIARRWKRHMLRKRLLKWITMRRRIRALFMRPYWQMWHLYASITRRGAMARKRAVLRAWWGYCDDMQHLHKAVIVWTADLMHTWQDTHLTWALCKKPGPETGERLLSTMLVSILRTQHIWRIKQYYFGRWNKYASGRRAKLQAIRASLGRALRARLLHRVAPAFKLWRRVAHYKQLERSRADVASQSKAWEDDVPEWQEWIHMREHQTREEERAHRHRARFLGRYFLSYWRFFLARNKQLRASWAFAARDRSALLKWMTLIAFKMLRKIAQRDRAMRSKVLRHWHAVMRVTSENRHLNLAQLVVDRRKLKAIALQAMHNHAQAMRAMRVAGMLQIQQRPVPVLMAIAAWSDQHHELWKILAWSAWRGYCMRRIRFKTLCGIIACRPESLLQRRALCAWLQVVSCTRAEKEKAATLEAKTLHASESAAHDSEGPVAADVEGPVAEAAGAPETASEAPQVHNVPGSSDCHTLDANADAANPVVDQEGTPEQPQSSSSKERRPLPEVSVLPLLWKEPLQKQAIMAHVPASQAVPPRKLNGRLDKMIRPEARSKQQGRLLPSIYETAPTPEGAQLLQLGQRGILAAAVSSTSASRSAQGGPRSRDSPLGPLWRLLVAARVAAVPHSRDPTLLTYVGAPSGVKGLHSTFSSRKGCSLASTEYHLEGATTCQECKEVDDFVERHGPGIAFLHRLAATEDYLEAKAHALLGIGAESSAKLYSILQQRLGPHVGSMPAHLLASLLQPLVESDCSLLEPHRKAWLRRDRLFATRMLLRHLAAAVNRERPQFTLVDNHATDERRWKAITGYQDSSTDEEGPEGSSIFWKLPLSHRTEYKPIVRAMRRAQHRRAYLTQLQRRGVLTMDIHPSSLKHIKVTKRSPRRKGRKGAAGAAPAQAAEDPHTVAVPDGTQPLPYALASPAALRALQWLAHAVKNGKCSGVRWSKDLLAMLIADDSAPLPPAIGQPAEEDLPGSLPAAHHALVPHTEDSQKSLGMGENGHPGDPGDTDTALASLASSEPSVLSTDSGAATSGRPGAGSVGELILQKVSCMPSVAPGSATTTVKSSLATQSSHSHSARTAAAEPSASETVASGVDASSGDTSPSASINGNGTLPSAAPVSAAPPPPSDPLGAPNVRSTVPHSSSVEPLQAAVSLSLAKVSLDASPQQRRPHSAAPAGVGATTPAPAAAPQPGLSDGLQKLVEGSSVPASGVGEEQQCVAPRPRQRPVSARVVPALGAPQATVARCEARRVRSARLAGRVSGEWGDGFTEGLDEKQQKKLNDMINRCRSIAASAVADYHAESAPNDAAQADDTPAAAGLAVAQSSGLEGIELAAALSHLSSQPARLSREAALAATYDMRDMHGSTHAPPVPPNSFDSHQAHGITSEGSGRLGSDTHSFPATVQLTFDSGQSHVHALERPASAPVTRQRSVHLQQHTSLPSQLLAGASVATGSAAATHTARSLITPQLDRAGSGTSVTGSNIAAVQPITSFVAFQHSLPTVASPSSPVGALTGSMSLPLSGPSHGALRRPFSAPIGSRILPSVPENSAGAMDAPDLAEAAAHDASLSLMGGSSRHTSVVVGSEASSASGQDFLPWRLPADPSFPGGFVSPASRNESASSHAARSHASSPPIHPNFAMPSVFTSSCPALQPLVMNCDVPSSQRSASSSCHVPLPQDAHRARAPLPGDAAAAQLAVSIWAALPEEHGIFKECSKLAKARRAALAQPCPGGRLSSSMADDHTVQSVTHVEVIQGLEGCTPGDDLGTLQMLHQALKDRVRRAPATRAWHLTARQPGEARATVQHTPKRCRHRRAQAKDGARPGAGNIICTGQNTQSRKQDEQRRGRSTANAAALTGSTRSTSPLPVYSDRVGSAVTRHRCSSAEPRLGMTMHGATRNASERASSAGPVGGPCRHTTDAVCSAASQPTSVPRRPHSCPAKHSPVRHHDAYAACNVGTSAPPQPPPVLASESTNEALLDVPEAAIWSTRGRVGQAHEPPRLPPPRLRTPAGARTVDGDVAESDMILGSAAPRAVRGPSCKHRRSRLRKVYRPGPMFSARANSKSISPGRSASGSPWSSHSPPRMARLRSPAEPSRIRYPAAEDPSPPVLGTPQRTGTAAAIDLNPRKPIPQFLKAGSGHAVWKASRSACSRDRARAQRASSRRRLARARAATAAPSCTPRRSSRRASGSKRRRSSHATKARLPGDSLASKRKRDTFLFGTPRPLDARIAKHVATGRTELAGRWHAAAFEASAGYASPGSLSEPSSRSISPTVWGASRSESPDAQTFNPSLGGRSGSPSRSHSPGNVHERGLQHGASKGADAGSSGVMRCIVADATLATGEQRGPQGCPSHLAMAAMVPKGTSLWMAPDNEQVEHAAGRVLEQLIDQKALKSEHAFQAVAASVAAEVEDDVQACIHRMEEYGVLVGESPMGVNFRPLRKLRVQQPTLGLHPSARKAAKKQQQVAANPIRVPTLPRRASEAVKYREEAIMDGVVAMIPEAPGGVSGLLTQQNVLEGAGMDDDAMEDGAEDSRSRVSGLAAQMLAAERARPRTQAPTEAELRAARERKEQQVLEERAAVAKLANAAAERRRELRQRSAAAYRAQQQRQWREGGIAACKDVIWAQSIIEAAVGNAPGSTGGAAAAAGSVAGGGLPPSKRADSALSGNVHTGSATRWQQGASATGQLPSPFHKRARATTPACTPQLPHTPLAVARPATVPAAPHVPEASLHPHRTRVPASATGCALTPQAREREAIQGPAGAAAHSSDVSQTVIAAANSVLHARTVTPPISNSAFGKSRKRVPKVQQSWQAPRTAKQGSQHHLAGAKHTAYQRSSPGGDEKLPGASVSGAAPYLPQHDLRQRLFASADARDQIVVSDRGLGAAAIGGTLMHVNVFGTRAGRNVATGASKPRRLADLETGLNTSSSVAGMRPMMLGDVSLRQRIQAPLGGIVPPAPSVAGRLSSRRKHRKAINYTLYNEQRFAEAARRKRELAVRQMQAAAAARAMRNIVQSGVVHEPPPRDVVGKW